MLFFLACHRLQSPPLKIAQRKFHHLPGWVGETLSDPNPYSFRYSRPQTEQQSDPLRVALQHLYSARVTRQQRSLQKCKGVNENLQKPRRKAQSWESARSVITKRCLSFLVIACNFPSCFECLWPTSEAAVLAYLEIAMVLWLFVTKIEPFSAASAAATLLMPDILGVCHVCVFWIWFTRYANIMGF